MRIAYLARWDVSHESGILKKMAAQVRRWSDVGHDVRFFAFSPGDSTWEGLEGIHATIRHGDSLWTRISSGRSAIGALLDWRPDIVYLRWSTYYPAWERIVKQIPTVVELNGDDVQDNRIALPFPLYIAHRVTRSRLLQRAAGMISVSRELARRPLYTRYGRPIVVIGNGIDLRRIEPLPAPHNQRARLVFLGYADREWHGIDKVWALAAACPDWDFDVIGQDEEGAPRLPNVMVHGHLGAREYLRILARADVALGTLALHRKHLDTTSAIKTGEYLAHGIPTIIAYEDTDFPAGHPQLLSLPNTTHNITSNIARVREFVERMRGQRVDRRSVEHLDIGRKEAMRLDFMARFAAAGGGR